MKTNDTQRGNNGAETESDGDVSPTRKLGLGDAKKVLILVGLLVVGGAVAAYQFLGGGGPTPATAVTAPTVPGAAATAPAPGAPGAPGAAAVKTDGAGADDELSVASVERLVAEFDGYVKARQVPLRQLKTSPFRLKSLRAPPTIAVDNNAGPGPVRAPEEVRAKPRLAMPKFVLGSIMVAGDKRWAVINGKLCSVGNTVSGCRVEAIEADHVRLSRDGETADLLLKPPAAVNDSRDTDGN